MSKIVGPKFAGSDFQTFHLLLVSFLEREGKNFSLVLEIPLRNLDPLEEEEELAYRELLGQEEGEKEIDRVTLFIEALIEGANEFAYDVILRGTVDCIEAWTVIRGCLSKSAYEILLL